jgi:hypothetical protein
MFGLIENCVVEIVEELLGELAQRERRFPWATGDPSAKTGRSVQSPFDAVWESRRLIIGVDEDQHRRAVKFFDKPDVMAVSGRITCRPARDLRPAKAQGRPDRDADRRVLAQIGVAVARRRGTGRTLGCRPGRPRETRHSIVEDWSGTDGPTTQAR